MLPNDTIKIVGVGEVAKSQRVHVTKCLAEVGPYRVFLPKWPWRVPIDLTFSSANITIHVDRFGIVIFALTHRWHSCRDVDWMERAGSAW